MGFWGALWFTETLRTLQSIQPAQQPAQHIQEWVRTAPHLPTDFTSLSANQMEWMPVACLPTTHVEWKSGGGQEGPWLHPKANCAGSPGGQGHGGARINIELS